MSFTIMKTICLICERHCVLLPSTKPAIHAIADELGVSFSSLLIQLKKYNLVDRRDMQEYFLKMREAT